MCKDDDEWRSLYRALRSIRFDPLEKPSPWENLTDVLEILAVWQGIKPAHLSGRGFRSERLLVDLESVALQYGLLTLRTPPHWPHWHREPSVDRGFLEWHQQRQRHEASAAGAVLWIYRDALLKNPRSGFCSMAASTRRRCLVTQVAAFGPTARSARNWSRPWWTDTEDSTGP